MAELTFFSNPTRASHLGIDSCAARKPLAPSLPQCRHTNCMALRQVNADQEPVGGLLMKPHGEAGQALVVVALMLVVLVSVMGLAIDMGYFRYMKRQLQTAADAGAVAGALEINSCGGSPGCGNLVDAAQKASAENGFTDGTTGVTVTVNNPPTTAGDPHSGDGKYVEVIVSQPEPTHFSNIFGVASTTLTARGEAKASSGNCTYAINMLDVGAATLNAPQCGIVVEANFDCDPSGSIRAPRIGVVSPGSLSPGCSMNPSPVHIATPTPRDP